jgi:hypothetical protein
MGKAFEAAMKKVREACAEIPGYTEGAHFGDVSLKSKGKMFASVTDTGEDAEILFGLEPDHYELLLASDPRFTAFERYAYCLQIRASQVKDWGELKALLLESWHRETAGRKARKARARTRK